MKSMDNSQIVKGSLWSGGSAVIWKPGKAGEKKELSIPIEKDSKIKITMTLANSPESGKIRVYFKDNKNDDNIFDLRSEYSTISRNHVLKTVDLKTGNFDLIIENMNPGKNFIGIDFIWVQ